MYTAYVRDFPSSKQPHKVGKYRHLRYLKLLVKDNTPFPCDLGKLQYFTKLALPEIRGLKDFPSKKLHVFFFGRVR